MGAGPMSGPRGGVVVPVPSATPAAGIATRWRAAIVGALTGLLGLGAIQYRRNNRRAAIEALREAVSPPQPDDPLAATEPDLVADVAHAPGHRHLGPPPAVPVPRRVARRADRADRVGHPPRFG